MCAPCVFVQIERVRAIICLCEIVHNHVDVWVVFFVQISNYHRRCGQLSADATAKLSLGIIELTQSVLMQEVLDTSTNSEERHS